MIKRDSRWVSLTMADGVLLISMNIKIADLKLTKTVNGDLQLSEVYHNLAIKLMSHASEILNETMHK